MIIDNTLQKYIDAELIKEDAEKQAKHEPSGKLSASWLFQPLRYQVMKAIGVPKKQLEPYVLGKFKRGNDCEDYVVNHMKNAGMLIETQKEVVYRNTIGFVDAVVDSKGFNFKSGTIPHEIKSVTNAKLKRIQTTGVDYHYQLQGGFYALAMQSLHFAINIVSAEDLRINTYIFDTANIAPDIEEIITKYQEAIKKWETDKMLPALEVNPKVAWAVNPDYAPFSPEWLSMTDKDIVDRLTGGVL